MATSKTVPAELLDQLRRDREKIAAELPELLERGKRLDEMIPALRALWRGGWVSFQGRYYQVPELMLEPHPPAPVPILCGGESEACRIASSRPPCGSL